MRFLLPFVVAALVAPLAPAAHAATTLSGVEGMTTTVFQEQQTSFSGLGFRVIFQSDELVEGFAFVPGIEYWRNSTRLQQYEINAMRRDATLVLDARYHFRFNNLSPYLGAGYGLHFLTTEVEAPGFGLPRAETSLTKGGISVLGGILVPMGGRFQNFMEVKYHHVTDYSQFKLNFGIGYAF